MKQMQQNSRPNTKSSKTKSSDKGNHNTGLRMIDDDTTKNNHSLGLA